MNARTRLILAASYLAVPVMAHPGTWLPGPLTNTPGGANDGVYASVM
jgi:hypothetical protein